MILELQITKDFYFLGRKYEAGDIIAAQLSEETLDEIAKIYKSDDRQFDDLSDEEVEKLNSIKSTHSETLVKWFHRPLTEEEKEKGMPHIPEKLIFCKIHYNLSASEFLHYLYSINEGKMFPEDIEAGYKIIYPVKYAEIGFVPVCSETKAKIIKGILGNHPLRIEAHNEYLKSNPEHNIFNRPILSNDEITDEALETYDNYNKGQFFEFKDGDALFIMEVSCRSLEMENGFKGYDYSMSFYKSNMDYSNIEHYENFSEIYINTLKKSDTHNRM